MYIHTYTAVLSIQKVSNIGKLLSGVHTYVRMYITNLTLSYVYTYVVYICTQVIVDHC